MKKTNFKGLEISEMDFLRKKGKCNGLIKDSCGTRDCNLEVYKLGEDIIYSGGLCPKGNTNFNSKKAPNYVLIYQNILNEHLKKFITGGSGDRVLIPRSLTFLNEKGVFYCSLYYNLGFKVWVSPESNEEISELGKNFSHSEFCYPLILAHGHAAFLKEKMTEGDKLLLVDVIGEGNNKYKFCPYVASSGNVIAGNLDLDLKNVLMPIIYFDDKDYPIYKAVLKDLERVYGKGKFSKKQVFDAVKLAESDQKSFLDEVFFRGEEILNGLEENGGKAFVAIGRGYTIFDSKASSSVHELFVSNGLHFIPSYFFGENNYDADSMVENMYWSQGRKIIEKTFFSFKNKNLFPVRLTNFNCGPDSILHFHEEKIANDFDKPWLVLETDGHNSNAQFGTRILAHSRVVNLKNYDERKINFLEKRNEEFFGRLIGLPYMGDGSDILAAALRVAGLKAEVMPTRTPESIEIAKKIISTNTCRPFSYQIGDHIFWVESLKKKGIDPNKEAAVFLPTTKGPCRFGQYSVVLKRLLDERGFEKVPVINPNSGKDYSDLNISKFRISLITRTFFKGNFANELLKSCLFRSRPYEIKKGESDEIYENAHKQLVRIVESNASLGKISRFLKEKLSEFKNIKKSEVERFPLVLMNGEIFIRSHELSNEDSIKLLEKHKLEIVLEPVFSWIDYVNKNMIKKSFETKNFPQLTASLLKRAYIKHIQKVLFKPFKDYLKGREIHDPFHLIEAIEKNLIYNSAIEGESCISIGGAYAFIKDELPIDGIYHVGPLGCMHETIATSRIHSLINKERNSGKELIPFMDAVFGESQIANLDSQIGIFAENCWLKKRLQDKVYK